MNESVISEVNSVTGKTIKASRIATPLGPMLACVGDRGVYLLEFTDSYKLEERLAKITRREKLSIVKGRHPMLSRLRGELKAYFQDATNRFSVPLHLSGTEFQHRIWTQLCATRAGETMTYAGLAIQIGRETAIRATAAANGANPVSILVPCHRVLGINGELTGYGGGVERKAWLLEHEGVADLQP